jgi:dimethylargininase
MRMLTALTRAVSPSFAECELLFHQREPIDVSLAILQHARYEQCLRRLGVRVLSLPAEPELPDAVFVEDPAVVVDEVAVLTAPVPLLRRREVASIAAALRPYRPLRYITGSGASLEGGDVLRIDHTLYVGLSRRTNAEGVGQLAAALQPYGYELVTVPVTGCLHLKSACTYVGQGTLLINRHWLDPDALRAFDAVAVAPEEPGAANALLIGETVLLPESSPRTRELLARRGFRVESVDNSEFQKAEGALTCCSILMEIPSRRIAISAKAAGISRS